MLMQQSNASLWSLPEIDPARVRRWSVAAALMIGVLLGSALAPLASQVQAELAGTREPAVAARAWPERPLPPEWRWSPPAVKYEHMFMGARR